MMRRLTNIERPILSTLVTIAVLWFYSSTTIWATINAATGAQQPARIEQQHHHPHTGKVAPFKSGDPGVKLDNAAIAILKSGEPYKTQIQSGTGGRGMVVQDVHAPTSVVWDRILDFNSYPKMVPKTVESQIYRTEKLKRHQQRIWVRMKIGFPVLKLQFYVNHLYDPSKNSLTWTLDYSVKSDLDDSCGYWYVVPHPDNPTQWSRVYYSVEVSMFAWVPQFVVDFMSKQALIDATAWVKKYSELEVGAPVVESSTSSSSSSVDTATNNKRRRGFALPWQRQRWGQKRQRLDSDSVTAPATTDATAAAAAAASSEQQRIGLTRYALVSTVLVLSLYNVHLYLSQ